MKRGWSWLVFGTALLVAMSAPHFENGMEIARADTPGLRPVVPHAESGQAQTTVYVPPLAGPKSQVSGTVENQGAGANGFYVATFDQRGGARYYRGDTDSRGRFRFVIPAGAVSVLVFTHFDAKARAAGGASCAVSSNPLARVPGTQMLPPSAGTTAIVAANSAYERGKLVQLEVRGVSGPQTLLLVDGSAAGTDTLAASDRSLVGRIHADAPLGRHNLAVQSAAHRSASVPADFIDASLSAAGSHETGGTQRAVLKINGLAPGEKAFADFDISGSAELARGGTHVSVPVAGDQAAVDVRGVRPGEAIVHWRLRVDIPPFYGEGYAEATPTPYPYYTTSRPPATPVPKRTATPKPGAHPGTVALAGDTPGPGTDSRNTPSPTPSPTPTVSPEPTPTSSPPPTPTPSPTPNPCKFKVSDGWFELTQGVWQDDPDFADKPGKQLTRMDWPGIAQPTYREELGMVKMRDSAIYGLDHYQYRGAQVDIPADLKRHYAVIKIKTNCSTDVPVKLRFRGDTDITPDPIFLSDVIALLPLKGEAKNIPENQWPEFTVKWPIPYGGLPYDTPVRITQLRPWTIWMDLVDQNNKEFDPRLDVQVFGGTDFKYSLKVYFVPVMVGVGDSAAQDALFNAAGTVANESAANIPDYFPLLPGQIKTARIRPISFQQSDVMSLGWGKRPEQLQALLADRLGVDAYNLQAGRMIAVIGKDDFKSFNDGSGVANAAAWTLTTKVIIVQEDSNHWTVAHELIHTIRQASWSSPQMIAQCDKDYHNSAGEAPDWKFGPGRDAPFGGPANGVRLTTGGRVDRTEKDRYVPVMGPVGDFKWITQCSYKHLYDSLTYEIDPPVTVVRGYLHHNGNAYEAKFNPFYDVMAGADSRLGTAGDFAFVVRNARGAGIAAYRFHPEWATENGTQRSLIAFAYALPRVRGPGTIELVGPAGVLARTLIAAHAPAVQLLAPRSRNLRAGPVTISWRGSAPDVRYTLYVLSAGRAPGQQLLFEQTQTSALVILRKGTTHFRLVAAGGGRSAELNFSLSAR